MSLLSEFRHALKDGLGKKEAAKFNLSLWADKPETAIAYSREKKQLLMLLLADHDYPGLSKDQYLDTAKEINKRYSAFVVPDQRVGAHILWGGKDHVPVYIYKFKVLNDLQGDVSSLQMRPTSGPTKPG